MFTYWIKRDYLTWSGDHATITYDPPGYYEGGLIRLPTPGPTSCVWIVPGTWDD